MIPVNAPLLGEREAEYVLDCVRTGWVSSAGRYIADFETQWATTCGRKFGVAVSNGTIALDLAVSALDLKPGDEVILPTFTIISCAAAVVRAGATPVLVDADPRTWTMDVGQVAQKITPRTRALMPVHLYGHPADMTSLMRLARDHSLSVIEDAAEAHGAELHDPSDPSSPWLRCGSFGRMSCFSFYANKLITTGEGGMILTDEPALAERLRSLRNLCFQPRQRFLHDELGTNARLTNLQAALGLAQIERFDEIVRRKRDIGAAYTERLRGIPGLQLPVEESWARSVYWMYGVVLAEDRPFDAKEFAHRLHDYGIETRPFFLGMHEQPAFQRRGLFGGERHPVAERLARRGLHLPSGLALTSSQIQQVCSAVRKVLA